MAQNFTDAVTDALQTAVRSAQQNRNSEVTQNHLLQAFLSDSDGFFFTFLLNLNTQPQVLMDKVNAEVRRLPKLMGDAQNPPSASRDLSSLITEAQNIAEKWKDSYTSTDHFLMAYWKGGNEPFATWKNQTGISL